MAQVTSPSWTRRLTTRSSRSFGRSSGPPRRSASPSTPFDSSPAERSVDLARALTRALRKERPELGPDPAHGLPEDRVRDAPPPDGDLRAPDHARLQEAVVVRDAALGDHEALVALLAHRGADARDGAPERARRIGVDLQPERLARREERGVSLGHGDLRRDGGVVGDDAELLPAREVLPCLLLEVRRDDDSGDGALHLRPGEAALGEVDLRAKLVPFRERLRHERRVPVRAVSGELALGDLELGARLGERAPVRLVALRREDVAGLDAVPFAVEDDVDEAVHGRGHARPLRGRYAGGPADPQAPRHEG